MKKTKTIIKVPAEHNELIVKALDSINSNEEILALWDTINVNAIDRLKMSDHGAVHFQIVANISLRLARLLEKNDIELSVVKDHGLTQNHGELVILLASLFHDLGMTISREGHEEFSLILANNLLRETLDFLPVKERTIVTSETLHAIISHRKGGKPYTVEAGIVRIADALDMQEGRARVTFDAGDTNIHTVSAAAIDKVIISEGKERPVAIEIVMNNSAGVFQTDELLKSKIKGSGIEELIEVEVSVKSPEKSLIKNFRI